MESYAGGVVALAPALRVRQGRVSRAIAYGAFAAVGSIVLVLVLVLVAPGPSGVGGAGSTPRPAVSGSLVAHGGLSRLPMAAQGPVSASVGAASAGYAVLGGGGIWRAVSAAQHLRASFARSGIVVRTGSDRLGIGLRAVGFGSSLRAVAPVSPVARANRVSYAHPGVGEWYANGPLGVEQGFTITRAPSGSRNGPLTLSLRLSGNLSASLAAGGRELRFTAAGKAALAYRGLVASDARGRALRAWLVLRGRGLLVRVDARGARFPVRIDPLFQNGTKLTGSGAIGTPGFGASVAFSADGATALIGGPYDNNNAGAAWVFTRSGAAWTQQGPKLTASDETGNGYFGLSVALSSDGNTALIGGSNDNSAVGAAWVFTRTGANWTQQGTKLTGHRRDRCRVLRLKRRVVLRWQHGTDRRQQRQQQRRRGVGVHPLGSGPGASRARS